MSALFIGMLTGGASCDKEDKCDRDCEDGYVIYSCKVPILGWRESCQPHNEAARQWCNTEGGTRYVELNCGIYGGETGGSAGESDTGSGSNEPWDPAPHVSYNTATQKYEVDQSFVDSLIADYQQLGRDSAYLTQVVAGTYSG